MIRTQVISGRQWRILALMALVWIVGVQGVAAQSREVILTGAEVDCPDGMLIRNGIEIVTNIRSGFTYTATVIGINGFDPVLAVNSGGNITCNDDSALAATYTASLPTTGLIEPASFNSQLPFSHTGTEAFGDVSLIVGGYNNTPGEFLLIIEGMSVTASDGSGVGAGDPFRLYVDPVQIAYGAPINVYMFSIASTPDSFLYVYDDEAETIYTFSDGRLLFCDDAGNEELCFGSTVPLAESFISRADNRTVPGGSLDAHISVPLDNFNITVEDAGYLNFLFSSYQQETTGDYIAAFHLGIASSGAFTVDDVPAEVAPPAGGTLAYGDTVNSALVGASVSGGDQEIWRFDGSAGDAVTITMIADDMDRLDTRLYLYTLADFSAGDPELIENDDAADRTIGRLNSQIVAFELPSDGEYVIRASCFVRCDGDYTLTLELAEIIIEVIDDEDTPAEPQEPADDSPVQSNVSFNVVLNDVGDSLLGVVREVRNLTGLSLIEVRDLVESVPVVILELDNLQDAETAAEVLRGMGAEVEVVIVAAFGGGDDEPVTDPSADTSEPVTDDAPDTDDSEALFNVVLTGFENRADVTNVVRRMLNLTLAESLALVNAAPVILLEGVDFETADAVAQAVRSASGEVDVIPAD